MNSHWYTTSAKNMFQWYLNLATPSRPTQFWLALSANSADPAAGVWSELTISNYARKQITLTYGGDIYATNSNQLNFANLGAGSILGQRIYDASSSGNLLFWADLDNGIAFATGHTITYNIGQIRVGATL